MSVPLLLWVLGCFASDPAPAPATPPGPEAPAAASVAEAAPEAAAPRLDVRALSIPAAWLADRVGGARVAVTTIVPVGEDPPAWRPSPELVAGLADADLVVAVGAGYEAWTATATLRGSTFVDSAHGLDLIELPGTVHRHGKAGEHSHAGADPHTWMDPTLWLAQAGAVHAALVRADPDGQAVFDANLVALKADIDVLDATLAEASAPLKGLRFAANHPSFNYLARRYGLDVRTIDLDPEATPSPEARAAVEAWRASAGERAVLLWEAPPSAATIAALPDGIEHVALDPLEQPWSGGYDWLAQARGNATRLRRLAEPAAP